MEYAVEALLEYGALGIFAAFLVWQHLSMQKRFDNLVEKFQKQLQDSQNKADAAEEKLRGRYDAVITQYQDEKTKFNMAVLREIEKVEKKVAALPFESLQINMEATMDVQRQISTMVEKGLDIIKDMQEEAKMREMARKIKDELDG